MLVHNVYFWLRKDLRGDQFTNFRIALETLKSIESAETFYIGSPAEIEKRKVVVDTYDYCLTVIFKNSSAHDTYQVDPLHKEFVRKYESYWKRVKIFNSN